MAKKVCLVLGAGAGIGGTVAKKFAKEGYYACLCRRSDQEGLNITMQKMVDMQVSILPQKLVWVLLSVEVGEVILSFLLFILMQ